MTARQSGARTLRIHDEQLFTTRRLPLGVLRVCLFCSHKEVVPASHRGVGRGHGFREGNKARGRMISHVKTAHPDVDAARRAALAAEKAAAREENV